MIGLGMSILSRRRHGSAALPPPPAAVAGAARTSFGATGLTPAFHYHPNSEASSVNASGQIIAVAANAFSPELTATAAGVLGQTDLRGIKRWRWEGASAYLDLPTSFDWDNRAFSLFMVGRWHKQATTCAFFGSKFTGDGTTVANLQGSFFGVRGATNNTAAWPNVGNQLSYNQSGIDKPFIPLGAQLAVVGAISRISGYTEDGLVQPVRWYHNSKTISGATAAQTLAADAVTGKKLVGGRIGGYLNSNGTPKFDLYEIVAFKGQLSNTQSAAVAAALMANWGLADFTRNIVLEGDSITDGIAEISSGDSLGMAMTEPGLGLVPENVRLLNIGVSGSKVAECITRRDVTNGWPSMRIGSNPADNILMLQIGRNDTAAYIGGGATGSAAASSTFADILNYHNDAVNGVVARGWKPVQVVNVRNGNMDAIGPLQAQIRSDFAANVPSGALIDLPLIQHGANRPFDTGPFATYYQNGGSDTTHPNELGTQLMAAGGDTPQHAYGAIL